MHARSDRLRVSVLCVSRVFVGRERIERDAPGCRRRTAARRPDSDAHTDLSADVQSVGRTHYRIRIARHPAIRRGRIRRFDLYGKR